MGKKSLLYCLPLANCPFIKSWAAPGGLTSWLQSDIFCCTKTKDLPALQFIANTLTHRLWVQNFIRRSRKKKKQSKCMKMWRPVWEGLDLDNRLWFVKPPVIFWVALESLSQQRLQGLGWAVGASARGTGDNATHHCHHQHRHNNAYGDDLRQGVSSSCGGGAQGHWGSFVDMCACVCAYAGAATHLATGPHRSIPGFLGQWETSQHWWRGAKKEPCWISGCAQ